MQGWQTSYLGLRNIPGELSEFELQAFFSFSRAEHELLARRRSDSLKLGLALHIGFTRMSGEFYAPKWSINSLAIRPGASTSTEWRRPGRISSREPAMRSCIICAIRVFEPTSCSPVATSVGCLISLSRSPRSLVENTV